MSTNKQFVVRYPYPDDSDCRLFMVSSIYQPGTYETEKLDFNTAKEKIMAYYAEIITSTLELINDLEKLTEADFKVGS